MVEMINGKTREELEVIAAEIIAEAIEDLLKEKNKVVLGVPGGTSVSGIFRNLLRQRIDWSKVHIFMVDERLVDIDSDDSNFKQLKKSLIDSLERRGDLSLSNIHPFEPDFDEDDLGLSGYTEEIKRLGGRYDILLLSSGEDGHVGAVYPNHKSVESDAEYFLTMNDSPKPPKERMTSSRKLMENSLISLLLFFGEGKQDALNAYLDDSKKVEDCPAKIVNSIQETYVLTDL